MPTTTDLAFAVAWYVVFVLSATVHEAAHAWAAKLGGDPTAYMGGQVSLNPVPHIKREIWGMVILPLISVLLIGWPFGYASTPYDARWANNHPRRAALMSIAGPLANLLIVAICFGVIKLGILNGIFLQPYFVNFRQIVDPAYEGAWSALSLFVSMMFTMNLILFILNLIPFPPLDGSNIISFFLSDNAARIYQNAIRNPMFAFIGFFLAWMVFSPIFQFIFIKVINVLYWGSLYA